MAAKATRGRMGRVAWPPAGAGPEGGDAAPAAFEPGTVHSDGPVLLLSDSRSEYAGLPALVDDAFEPDESDDDMPDLVSADDVYDANQQAIPWTVVRL